MNESQALLQEFVTRGSEPAFATLVSRYINFVHSTALRLANGDPFLAKDITQTVFINLARQAATLPTSVQLGGWLHQNAWFVAANLRRTERRRAERERLAMEMHSPNENPDTHLRQIAPVLDEAILQLRPDDQTALALRFFDQQDFATIAKTLSTTEDAARMRVNRALEKLRTLLGNRGINLSAAALGSALGISISSAPTGLAATITATALATATTGVATALSIPLLPSLIMSKSKAALIGTLLAAGIATPLILQHQARQALELENQHLRQQRDRLIAETTRPSPTNPPSPATPPTDPQLRELLRLRGEVGVLRRELAEKNAQLAKASQDKPAPTEHIPTAKEILESQGRIKLRDSQRMGMALYTFAQKNGGNIPGTIRTDDLLPLIEPSEEDGDTTLPTTFELVFHGSFDDLPERQKVIVFREKVPWQTPDGDWYRTYTFGDGHSEIHRTSTELEMQAWESARMVPPAGTRSQPR